MTFNSNKNKELVWNILLEQNLFYNLDNNHFSSIKNKFDELFIKYESENGSNLDKNKIIIKEFTIFINNIKKNNLKTKDNLNQNILKPLEEIKLKINSDFKDKQDEFISLIKLDKPSNEPIFEDKEDIPFSDDQLQEILDKKKAERELIKPPINYQDNNNKNLNEKHVTFKLEEIKDLKDKDLKDEDLKEVVNKNYTTSETDLDISFGSTELESTVNLFSKLKKYPDDNNYNSKLDIIINNQNKIIKILEKFNN